MRVSILAGTVMVDFEYLYKGLCGLARAHQANSMAGHLGAAVAAGYFFGEEHPDLDERVVAAVQHELDRIIGGEESLWFDPKKLGITIAQMFEPFAEEDSQDDRIQEIAEALSANIDELRESGHNVIFASIALRALHDHRQYATSAVIEGIVKLIQSFDNAGPGRGYFGLDRGWIIGDPPSLPPDDLPAYTNQQDMATAVIDAMIRLASTRRRGYGSLFHIINHATAITELSRFGYNDLAQRGLKTHHYHLRLWRALPDVSDELGALVPAEYDPRSADYWRQGGKSQWSAHLTHRVKTLYGFFSLLRFIDDPTKRTQAENSFRYLMA